MGTDARLMLFCGLTAVLAGCSLMSGDVESQPVEKVTHCAAVRPKLEIPPPGAVKPAGWIRDVAEAQRDGYTGHMDEFDVQFERAWRETTRPRGKDMAWNADPGAWSCEGGAYWFDGLVRLAYQLDDPQLKTLASNRLETVLSKMSDRAIGFCWWLDRNDPAHVGEMRDSGGWLVWVTGMFARPVCAWHEATGDRRAASALGQAFGTDLFGYDNFATTPSGAYEAWRRSGDPRVAAAQDTFCTQLKDRPKDLPRVFTQYARSPDPNLAETLTIKRRHQWAIGMATRHGVIASESLLSVLDAYLWTGNADWLQAVRGGGDPAERRAGRICPRRRLCQDRAALENG